MIDSRRKAALCAKAVDVVAQEARHLADVADYDEITESDEEDDYLREALRAVGDEIAANGNKFLEARVLARMTARRG